MRGEEFCRGDWPVDRLQPVARNDVKDRFTNSNAVTSDPNPTAIDATRTGDRPIAPTSNDRTPILPIRYAIPPAISAVSVTGLVDSRTKWLTNPSVWAWREPRGRSEEKEMLLRRASRETSEGRRSEDVEIGSKGKNHRRAPKSGELGLNALRPLAQKVVFSSIAPLWSGIEKNLFLRKLFRSSSEDKP